MTFWWKFGIFIASYALVAFAGWHSHTWYDGYNAQKTEVKIVNNLGKGEADIVNFNENLDKAKANVTDTCIDKPIPVSINGLLK